MDRKSIIVLLASIGLILLWPKLVDQIYPRKPLPQKTTSVSGATNLPASTNLEISDSTLTSSNTLPVPVLNKNAPEELLVVTNDTTIFTFTSHGGGLKLIELKGYLASVDCTRKTAPLTNSLASLNTHAPIPILDLIGNEFWQSEPVFQLVRTDSGVRAEKVFPGDLKLVKEFVLGSNYLLNVKVRLENHSSEARKIPEQEWVIGTATPLSVHDSGQSVGLFWYNGSKAEHITEPWFANRTLGCIPGTPRRDYLSPSGASNVVWAAVHNQFFALAIMPQQPVPQVIARHIDLPPPSQEILTNDSKAIRKPVGFQTAILYPASILKPNEAIEKQFTIYAGPKEYNTLARLGDRLKNNLDAIMDFGGFFGFFAKALLLSMNGLHAFGLTYAFAIICITIIVKLLFWPLTNASTKSMKRMQALQPQMKAMQEKYKGEPQKLSRKQMEFYKEHKVNPVGGCLPMLLQIPVFFGFYKMLQSAIELRGASFLWACDLSQQDTIAHVAGFPVNPMPLIMGATMLWQAHLTPAAPGADAAQQKMMKYMPLMFIVFLYNREAGLTLYWTVQNLLTILQTKLTKAKEEPVQTPIIITPPKKKK
ncbi:MAG: membrane protein insertase YidC [Verrucomicrobiota bacterium]|nr:membrane protein insertase YidC [Verrucomicrobiota bacterium]